MSSSTNLIKAINTVRFSDAYNDADIQFSTGTLTYNNELTSGTSVDFSSATLNTSSITSTPTQLISPSTTTAGLYIGAITIDGTTKSLQVNNVTIIPGHRYELDIVLQNTCTSKVGFTSFSTASNGTNYVYSGTIAETDNGLNLDIYALDNDFSMTVNGTAISTSLIQFQYSGTVPVPENVKFADGSYYGDGTVPELYNLQSWYNTGNSPSVRVAISADGNVYLYGVKATNGTLYPLVLTNGNEFQKVTWNTSGTNTINISQTIDGSTKLDATIYGKQTCTN